MNLTDTRPLAPFTNEPFTDFTTPENQRAMQQALTAARAELGRTYDLVLGGKPVQMEATFASVNPAAPAEVIGRHYAATAAGSNAAVAAANSAFAAWSKTAAAERVGLLVRAAGLLRERHLEFCAWLTL